MNYMASIGHTYKSHFSVQKSSFRYKPFSLSKVLRAHKLFKNIVKAKCVPYPSHILTHQMKWTPSY